MEHVLVVDRMDLFGTKSPQGMISMGDAAGEGERWLRTIDTKGYFSARPETEKDPDRKQIIPYCIVFVGEEILLLKRLCGGGERRLHSLLSIGVGGHINPVDRRSHTTAVLLEGARRELHEEIELPDDHTLEVIGFVNDDSNAVGSVHFGIVFKTVLPPDTQIRIKEHDQLEGTLVSVHRLREILNEEPSSFETWSRLVLERLEFPASAGN